jgi:diadenosine tetraphosphate (Ap4A) HIT family hydrolase
MAVGDAWILFLHQDQRYLGRAYFWLRRSGIMQRLSQLQPEELLLLHKAMASYEETLGRLWQPDHMNYAWLGNEFHLHEGHGRMHLIPRYKSPREAVGFVFTEYRWGKNYTPHERLILSRMDFERLRDTIQEELKL